jgi:tetratricopeptide (TPR) repeat protein
MKSDRTLMRQPNQSDSRGDATRLADAAALLARRRGWWTWLAAGLIVAAGVAAYANSLQGEFVFDDIASIRDNGYIRELWPLWQSMSLPLADGGETVARRPLLSLTFALNRQLLGAAPWGFHLVNLAVHIGAALLLFCIVRRTLCLKRFRGRFEGRSVALALLVALFWEVHPLQTESVTYIVQRAESLMGMLYLLTLYCSLRGFTSSRGVYWYTAAVLACAAGMGVKEVMATAPLMVFLYDGTFVSTSFREAWSQRWRFYMSLAATWGVLLLSQAPGWRGASGDFTDRSPLAYALDQPPTILHYLRLSIWPAPLVVNYGPAADYSVAYTVVSWCVVGVLFCAIGWGLFHRKWYGFLGAWFFLILAPSSSFAALMQYAAEHRLYLSLAAVVVLLVIAGDQLLDRRRASRLARSASRAAAVLSSVIVVAFIAGTYVRNEAYRSSIALWSDVVEKQPLNASAHYNLGLAYYFEKRYASAVDCFRRVLRINPEWGDAHLRLANALAKQRQWEQAAHHYLQAVSINPSNWQAYCKYAEALERQGKLEEAIKNYNLSLVINPRYWPADYKIGNLLAKEGRFAEAAAHYREALRNNPHHVGVHVALGVTLQNLGQLVQACDHFRRALAINPRNANAHFNLANALASRGELRKAVDHYHQSLAIKPEDADVQCNLGTTLLQLGMPDEARTHFREATRIDSRHWQAHVMLGKLYLDQGRRESAIENLQRALEVQPDSELARQLLQQARGA